VFVSGQEPEDEQGNLVGPGDLAAQAGQVFAIEAARAALFGDHKPADAVVGVQALSRPEYLMEVEAIAVID
jgi:enamine deaminase RidA (YjgF/YER057c/UK114 family)